LNLGLSWATLVTDDDRGDTMSEQSLPPHVLTEIDSPIRATRLTGVDELARLANGADLAMAAAARLVLRRLTEDDSRSVAAAAATALERTIVRLNPDRVDFGQVLPGTAQMVADVLVDGPPLAVATATVTTSGPGLRAMLNGRQLRIAWLPETDWLDGLVTVQGPAGWADVHVTGQVTAAAPIPRAEVGPLPQADGWPMPQPGGWPMPQAGVGPIPQAGGVGPMPQPGGVGPMPQPGGVGPVPQPGVGMQPDGDDRLPPIRMPTLPQPAPRRRRAGTTVLIAGLTALVLIGGAGVAMALTNGNGSARPPVAAIGSRPAPAPVSSPVAPTPTAVVRVPLAARVVSTGKPTVVGTVRVGAEPEGVAVSPDGRTVYVANQGAHVLSVMDAGSRRVASVALRNTPRFVATSRDGTLVFVSMYENDKSGSGVAVVDAARRKVLRYLPTGVQPYTLAVSPDGRLWVPIHSEHRIEIYAAADQHTDGTVTVPPNPHAVGFAAGLMRAFTPNHESNVVSVIDMRTDQLLKSIPVSRAPHSIAVSPDGKTVLVAGYEANAANLIDAKTLKRTGPFKVGDKPQSVAFATDSAHAYVVNEGGNSVSVLDGHTGAVTATVQVGRSPRTVAVSPDGRLAYVSNGDDDTISVLQVGK
jgi:YVTN family beta-propeller protein